MDFPLNFFIPSLTQFSTRWLSNDRGMKSVIKKELEKWERDIEREGCELDMKDAKGVRGSDTQSKEKFESIMPSRKFIKIILLSFLDESLMFC